MATQTLKGITMAKVNEYDATTGENVDKTISAAELNKMLEGIETVDVNEVLNKAKALNEAKVAKLMQLGLSEEEARA